jgi:hypothetical protein
MEEKLISRKRKGVYILSGLLLLIFYGVSFAQDTSQSNWLPGVIFKLENMRDGAIADIQKYEGEIQKCDNTISKSENIVRLAQEKGNVKAEMVAREASIKATEAKMKNEEALKFKQFYKELLENKINELKNLIATIETNKPDKAQTEKIDDCKKLEVQLEMDKDVIKRYQKTIDMNNKELEEWAKMNEEAAKDAVKKGIELMTDAIAYKLEARETALNKIEGELKKYEAKAGLYGLPKQQELANRFLSKWSRAKDAYKKAKASLVAGKAIHAGLKAKETYEVFENDLVVAKALIDDTDNDVINTLEDPEIRASISDILSSGTVVVINLGDEISNLKNTVTATGKFFSKAASFASFIVDYSYHTKQWLESRDRILQFSELADDELKAVSALDRQIKNTMGKLKECRERAKTENKK